MAIRFLRTPRSAQNDQGWDGRPVPYAFAMTGSFELIHIGFRLSAISAKNFRLIFFRVPFPTRNIHNCFSLSVILRRICAEESALAVLRILRFAQNDQGLGGFFASSSSVILRCVCTEESVLLVLRILRFAQNDRICHCEERSDVAIRFLRTPRFAQNDQGWGYYSRIDSYKSIHWGFICSISAFFLTRVHPFICFSRAIADRTSDAAS